ncbi:MAG: hypothetical protein NTV99_03280 [Deltaproteobacteria bacterium]|nr:hypothetical protein [Deltaproteobacteria bacterium]
MIAALFICLMFAVAGCASKKDQLRSSSDTEKAVLKRIAIVPFQRLVPDDLSSGAVRCPICGTIYPVCVLPQNAEMVVQDVFVEKFSAHKQWTIIPMDRVAAVYSRISAQDLKATPADKLKKVGQEFGADGVVVGYVSCFRERKGYALSAERPASVTFGVYLIRVSDGALIWGKIFDKTQQSLMENLFQASIFFKKPWWLTARELAEEGVDEILTSYPGIE